MAAQETETNVETTDRAENNIMDGIREVLRDPVTATGTGLSALGDQMQKPAEKAQEDGSEAKGIAKIGEFFGETFPAAVGTGFEVVGSILQDGGIDGVAKEVSAIAGRGLSALGSQMRKPAAKAQENDGKAREAGIDDGGLTAQSYSADMDQCVTDLKSALGGRGQLDNEQGSIDAQSGIDDEDFSGR